jgi:hypothetical protein
MHLVQLTEPRFKVAMTRAPLAEMCKQQTSFCPDHATVEHAGWLIASPGHSTRRSVPCAMVRSRRILCLATAASCLRLRHCTIGTLLKCMSTSADRSFGSGAWRKQGRDHVIILVQGVITHTRSAQDAAQRRALHERTAAVPRP